MSEVVNALVAFAVIVFIFRWVTSGMSSSSLPCSPSPFPKGPSPASNTRSPTTTLGFRPKHVTQDMVDQIHTMFPDIPADNIRFDLLRTGSVELTTNKILERGFLEPPPPAYFSLYPRTEPTPQHRPTTSLPNTTTITTARPPSLIERYHLERKLSQEPKTDADEDAGGKAKWEDTSEKREASLRERKARMVLAARQRLLAQQQNGAAVASGSS